MKILLTGATGYIGKRVLPVLIEGGHDVVCAVRNRARFVPPAGVDPELVKVVEIDLLEDSEPPKEIADIDAAYYLVHSMSDDSPEFQKREELSAKNFVKMIDATSAKQIIYLGGIVNDGELSDHLRSRKRVGEILATARAQLTAIKAAIIVGSGSSSFEIIRDLVEKLPVMITPRWLNTRTQPVAIRDVLSALTGVLGREEAFGNSYDIGGPEVMTYKDMLLKYAEVRGLKRRIWTVPVFTPKLSSYWLYFVTSTSYRLAVNLVNSMKVEVVAHDDRLFKMLGIEPITYKHAVELAFQKIAQNAVVSSWKDSLISSYRGGSLFDHIEVPKHGVNTDHREIEITHGDVDRVAANMFAVGGSRGWYYGNWLWKLRGLMDRMFGGVGLRRGRTNLDLLFPGDPVDFWRVLVADKDEKRLLLYAEMKLPGEAWLEFKIIAKDGKNYLSQTATYRPRGILGRLYWWSVYPFHYFVFNGMANGMINYKSAK